MKTNFRALGWIMCIVVLGCVGTDFDKGTPIAELSLVQASTHTGEVHLAEGTADIVVAVRDGKCHPVNAETRISVAITGQGSVIESSMKLGDLTWAYAEGSCDAYGYAYDAATRLSKKFKLKRGDYKIDVEVRPGSPEQRTAMIWIIYGGRAPTTKMFPSLSTGKPLP